MFWSCEINMRISNWLYKAVNGWISLLALLIFIAFTILVLPRQAEKADTFSSDAGSPDMSLFYSPQQLYQMAEAYGEQGRQAYVQQRFTFDVVWPLVYTFFLCTAITWLYGRGFAHSSAWRRANTIPLIAILLDFLENLSTSLVMLRYPHPSPVIDWLAPVFTLLKWVFVVGSFILLLIGIVAYAWRLLTRRQLA